MATGKSGLSAKYHICYASLLPNIAINDDKMANIRKVIELLKH